MKSTLVKTSRVAVQIGTRKARSGESGPQPIWLAQGGSDDDDDTVDDSSTDGDADTTDDADAGGTTTDDAKTVPQAKFDEVKMHLSNADRKKAEAIARAEKAERELHALKTKDLPEAERATAEHEAVVKDRDSYRTKFEKLARTNAFLLASEAAKVSWANSTSALRVGDLEDLEIEDDGTVPGMADAVKRIAKEHPYLLAAKDSTDTEEKETPPTKSGSVVGSKKKGTKVEAEYSKDELRKIFPALR